MKSTVLQHKNSELYGARPLKSYTENSNCHAKPRAFESGIEMSLRNLFSNENFILRELVALQLFSTFPYNL